MSKKRSKKERHPSPIIGSDGEEQFFVEKILDKDEVDGCWMYKIRWAGYSPTHDTWEEAERMQEEVPEIAEEFEKKLAARKRKSQTKSESSQPR
uniref:Chromo domain-containing protein n=1 Tax=Panagrolaimus sp. JU765 TaxID=591449 RepID=A0AC34QF75_9BILA